jgi:hypothetical protein
MRAEAFDHDTGASDFTAPISRLIHVNASSGAAN